MFDLHKILAPFTSKRHGQEIPPLDGPFQPDDRLETAKELFQHDGVNNVCLVEKELLFSAGNAVFKRAVTGRASKPKKVFEASNLVTCVGGARDGSIVVGVENKGIHFVGGKNDKKCIQEASGRALNAVTAVLSTDDGQFVIANASSQHGVSDWTADLISGGRSGFVVVTDAAGSNSKIIVQDLAYPAGLSFGATQSEIIVCESWTHRLTRVSSNGSGASQAVLENLLGFPSRLVADPNGGYWLAFFGLRTQLLEFVLNDSEFKNRMMAQVDAEYWLAPSLTRSDHHMIPMQQGAVKKLGVVKPWAPPRSYGLVVRLNADFQPTESYHSRADGTRHGTTCLDVSGKTLFVSCFSSGEVVTIDTTSGEAE